MRVLAALGGNALLRPDESPEASTQARNVERAAAALEPIAREHTLVVTHGNGPQVGLLALQAHAYAAVAPYPLDVLGAESEGMIGYLIERELRSRLPGREVATLLTQVEVDLDDPAFDAPEKPIGPALDPDTARALTEKLGWHFIPHGEGARRVVPSPEPKRFLELGALRLLIEAGAIVVCAGGGGVPVSIAADGGVRGVEAVVDKDLASARLASELEADALLLLTDVDAVYTGWGSSDAEPLGCVTPSELASHRFEPGSMGPKVEAACRFVAAGRPGTFAAIGRLERAAAVLQGDAGTRVEALNAEDARAN